MNNFSYKGLKPCNNSIRSISAFMDYMLIFSALFLISLFFKSEIYQFIDLKINSLITLNSSVSEVGSELSALSIGGDSFNLKDEILLFLKGFDFLIYLLGVMYISFWLMVISFLFAGKTVGSKIFGIKIYEFESNNEATLIQKAIRMLVYVFDFFFLFGLGTAYSLFNKDKRGLAEIVSKTIVLIKK